MKVFDKINVWLNLIKKRKNYEQKNAEQHLAADHRIYLGISLCGKKSGMDYIQPFTFNGIRTLIGGLVLIPVVLLMNRGKDKADQTQEISAEEQAKNKKNLITGGICCGTALFVASSFQQFGVSYTTAGKSRLYHNFIRGLCSDHQRDTEKKSQARNVALRSSRSCRPVSAVYDGRSLQIDFRRLSGSSLRTLFCSTYHDGRLLHNKG